MDNAPHETFRRRQRITQLKSKGTIIHAFLLFITSNYFWLSPGAKAFVTGRTVWSEDGLYAAFLDTSVKEIEIRSSITITRKASGSWPILVERNVLVQGHVPYVRLNFNFASADRVKLAAGVQLTFRQLVLANLVSESQLAYAFFSPSDASSAIVWQDVVNERVLCPPLQTILSTWSQQPRPSNTSNGQQDPQQQPQQQQQRQVLALSNEPFCAPDPAANEELCWAPVLRGADVAVISTAGYQIRWNNSVVACDEFLAQALVARRTQSGSVGGPQVQGADTAPPSSSGLTSGARAGIIAGCVVGGVLLMLLLLVLVYLIRRRRNHARRAATAAASAAPFDSLFDVEAAPAGIMQTMRSSGEDGGGGGGRTVSGRRGGGTAVAADAEGGRTGYATAAAAAETVAAVGDGKLSAGGVAAGAAACKDQSQATTTMSVDLRSTPTSPDGVLQGVGGSMTVVGRWSAGRGSNSGRGSSSQRPAARQLAAPAVALALPQAPLSGPGLARGPQSRDLEAQGTQMGVNCDGAGSGIGVGGDGCDGVGDGGGRDATTADAMRMTPAPVSGTGSAGAGAGGATAIVLSSQVRSFLGLSTQARASENGSAGGGTAAAGGSMHPAGQSAVVRLLRALLGLGSRGHSSGAASQPLFRRQNRSPGPTSHTHTSALTSIASDLRRFVSGGGGGGGQQGRGSGSAPAGPSSAVYTCGGSSGGTAATAATIATAATAPAAPVVGGAGGPRSGGSPRPASGSGKWLARALKTTSAEPPRGGAEAGNPDGGPGGQARPTLEEIQQEVERLEGKHLRRTQSHGKRRQKPTGHG